MKSRWVVEPHDTVAIGRLSHETQLPPLVAQVLLNRRIQTGEQAQEFMKPQLHLLHDPSTLPGIPRAAHQLTQAIRERKRIVVYGDYDVDGVCGTSLLLECLNIAGAREASYYIPDRLTEGYGVNCKALDTIKGSGADVVVTIDCGISGVDEANYARSLGLEYIITDHHTIGPRIPSAQVVVHPRLEPSAYPFKDLCGAGVAFKLAWEIAKGLNDGKKASPILRDFLVRAVSLVAIATIADLVPLKGENRVLVRHGLRGLRDESLVGLHALLEVSNCLTKSKITPAMIGFQVAPRLNAAGRVNLGSDAVKLLVTREKAEAVALAAKLNQANIERQELERRMVEEARAMIDQLGDTKARASIVVAHESWHRGVIGIVASRLVDTYHRPTIVVALEQGISHGSARSIPELNVYEAIAACSQSLKSFGGHKAAAGIRLPTEALGEFETLFENQCQRMMTEEMRKRTLMIDAEVGLSALTLRVVEALDHLEPYGMENPRPVFLAHDVTLMEHPRIVGEKKNHAQFKFHQGNTILKAVGWNMADRVKDLVRGTRCDLVFQVAINEWNGQRTVQLEVKDYSSIESSAGVVAAG